MVMFSKEEWPVLKKALGTIEYTLKMLHAYLLLVICEIAGNAIPIIDLHFDIYYCYAFTYKPGSLKICALPNV